MSALSGLDACAGLQPIRCKTGLIIPERHRPPQMHRGGPIVVLPAPFRRRYQPPPSGSQVARRSRSSRSARPMRASTVFTDTSITRAISA